MQKNVSFALSTHLSFRGSAAAAAAAAAAPTAAAAPAAPIAAAAAPPPAAAAPAAAVPAAITLSFSCTSFAAGAFYSSLPLFIGF